MLTGSCHCGATGWRFEDDPTTVTACNCSLCRRFATLWSYGVAKETVHLDGETQSYNRADQGALTFHRCANCGSILGWYSKVANADGVTRAAVNLRLIDDPGPIQELQVRHFDGLETFSSLGHDGRTVKDMWF